MWPAGWVAYNDEGAMADPTQSAPDTAADPVIEAYKRDVDRTLVRQQLRRSVDERVQTMIAALRLAEELRNTTRPGRP